MFAKFVEKRLHRAWCKTQGIHSVEAMLPEQRTAYETDLGRLGELLKDNDTKTLSFEYLLSLVEISLRGEQKEAARNMMVTSSPQTMMGLGQMIQAQIDLLVRFGLIKRYRFDPSSPSAVPGMMLDLLQQVKQISEEDRNPEWGDNPRRVQCGKVCNSAAAASDLGATRRDQSMTNRLRSLVKQGYLIEVRGRNYAYFRLTEQGRAYIKANA
jgi:hypothetical protein